MTREEATRILDAVIPPPEHHTVDLDHLRIAQAWAYVKETLTAEPVKHGRWILRKVYEDEYGNGQFNYFCSECGVPAYEFSQPYCHRCGARMDGGENGTK